MRLFLPVKECIGRGFSRKKTLIVFGVLFLAGTVLGIVFLNVPAVYDHRLARCNEYLERVLYSDRNLFLVLLERTAGHALVCAVLLFAGVHPAALTVTPFIVVYRAYSFGGSLRIFISVFRLSGAFVIFPVYLPIHLLFDLLFLFAVAVSFERARNFCFRKQDFQELGKDFLIFFAVILLVCLAEMILLLVFFHPIGNVL